jgi:hypothetical protein
MLRLAAVLALATSLHVLAAGDRGRDFGPLDVEVRLRDGSQMRGEVMALDTLKLKTAYGVLNFPVSDLRQLQFGARLTEKDARGIQEAIALLDSDDFASRSEAQTRLERFGASALAPLKTALKTSNSSEVRSRIESLLKRLEKKAGSVTTDDRVTATELDMSGELELKSLRFRNAIGDLTVKIEDLESVRWLAAGQIKAFSIDARKGLQGWIDTGVNVAPNDPIALTASGSINLFGSCISTPSGHNNWGANPFMVGSLIGRIGKSGEPFMIGTGKRWTGAERERLYLKIFCLPDHLRSADRSSNTGSYRVRIATGGWIDDLKKPGEDNDDEAQDMEGAQQ